MHKEFRIDNTTLFVDVPATQKYRTKFNEPCDCITCCNYHAAVKRCSRLILFLNEFGIDTDRPEEVMYWDEDVTAQTIEYHSVYSVCGEINGMNVAHEIDGVKIDITAPANDNCSPNTGHIDSYFLMAVTVRLPWVLNESMSDVFKK